MKRTNVVLDERLVARAKKISGLHTTREVVDYALRAVVRAEKIQAIRALKGSDAWQGDLDTLRQTRS